MHLLLLEHPEVVRGTYVRGAEDVEIIPGIPSHMAAGSQGFCFLV